MLVLVTHHVQCDGQRVDIGVVVVVDDGAVVHARLDFQAHGDACQRHQPLCDDFGLHLHQQADGDAMDGILDGGLVGEGDLERQDFAMIGARNHRGLLGFLDLADKEVGFFKLAAPGEQLYLRCHT